MNTNKTEAPKKKSIVPVIIVLALFLLAGSALMRFANNTGNRRIEGAMKGKLSAMRGAIQAYYQDNGRFPDNLEALTAGHKYLDEIPMAWTGAESLSARTRHKPSNEVVYYPRLEYHDTGKWAYVTAGPDKGSFFVDCTHTDINGYSCWTQF
ncbi:MAG: hypothetical protein COT18_06370 [Elusimicrobia bacterium CG08_land_8_20_14_0_20_59_10]|nr:MAG: hypothetical protein COT18_06370 [Elusimicrobia bacterium CG08_land_8_20_14_0_20_59_10]